MGETRSRGLIEPICQLAQQKADRQNNPGSCDRASRSEDSAAADCILGMLASFSTVFVVKLAVSQLSHQQRYFVKSFLKVVRSQFLIYGEFGVNADRLLGKKVMETTNQKTIINLTGIRYISGQRSE